MLAKVGKAKELILKTEQRINLPRRFTDFLRTKKDELAGDFRSLPIVF